MNAKPTLISLFSGAGGLDYGLEAAGFKTGAATEIDGDCTETLSRNRKNWGIIHRSIFEVTTEEMLEVANTKRKEVDLVIGGPPCQPFSKSGYWANGDSKRLADPRAGTIGAYMRVIEDALPKVFLLENVEGLAYSDKNEGLRFVLDMITKINRKHKVNYQPTWRVLCAADYGVPQMRYRLFIVASREGMPFEFPAPTHAAPETGREQVPLGFLQPYKTAWDAIGDVRPDPSEDLEVGGKWADLLPSIPEGENYLWHTERGGGVPLFGWRRRYWNFLLKLSKVKPSWTIQAQPGPATGPFHWENRRLSMRELCRIQTFPDDVTITGNYRAVQRQVGNAVPSLLAEVLGKAIRAQLLGHKTQKTSLELIPPCRIPVPAAENHTRVPRKFHKLIGKHSAHPGTGQGNRAKAWAKQ